MPDAITLVINGQSRTFAQPLTGGQLLSELAIPVATAVAELNGEILPRDEFLCRELEDGDVLELVTLVGGG